MDEGNGKPSNDPFDPRNIRLGQNFSESLGIKPVLTHIPVKSKPPAQEFIRVLPDLTRRIEASILEWQADREMYLVAPDIHEALSSHAKPRRLLLTVTATNNLFLWALKLTPPGERENTWNLTAYNAAVLAEQKWINMISSSTAQAYLTREAEGIIPEPTWPDLSLAKILELSFRDRFIQSLDHPVVKKLKGIL